MKRAKSPKAPTTPRLRPVPAKALERVVGSGTVGTAADDGQTGIGNKVWQDDWLAPV